MDRAQCCAHIESKRITGRLAFAAKCERLKKYGEHPEVWEDVRPKRRGHGAHLWGVTSPVADLTRYVAHLQQHQHRTAEIPTPPEKQRQGGHQSQRPHFRPAERRRRDRPARLGSVQQLSPDSDVHQMLLRHLIHAPLSRMITREEAKL